MNTFIFVLQNMFYLFKSQSIWAREGVLLLNTTLTVKEHLANSHSKCGWAWFTDNVIKLISDNTENIVFILWGGNARLSLKNTSHVPALVHDKDPDLILLLSNPKLVCT